MELYVHTLMYWRKKKAKLKELSNNISDRSEAKGTGIMSDLLLVNGDVSEANEPDTSGKSVLYYIIDMDSSSYSSMVMYDKRLGIRIKQRTPNTAAMP